MYIPVTAFLRERKPRFFEGLEPSDIRTILAAGTQQHFSANSVIARQGYPARHLYLLLTGRLRRFFTTKMVRKLCSFGSHQERSLAKRPSWLNP